MTHAELRRLLELAAKAYFGHRYKGVVRWTETSTGGFWEALTASGPTFETEVGFERFNPADDDGDSRRLEVKLQIDVKQYGDHVVAWFDGGFIGTGRIPYDGDPCAATRLAVLRAAAAIGEATP